MPLHDTANVLAKPQHGRHGRSPTEGLSTEKAAPAAKGAAQSPRDGPKGPSFTRKGRQELKDGRLNAAASHAAKKGLAQKPRSSRDRAEFDAGR